MKTSAKLLLLPAALLLPACQQTTVHTTQTSAALAGASTGTYSGRPGTTAAAAGASVTSAPRMAPTQVQTSAVISRPSAPAPARKPEKREIYEEQTSEVVETYVFPASDEEMGR